MRLVSVTSGKGGVGKTNISANLGIALSQLGYRVVLFDADLGLANLDVVLGANAEYSLHHALDGNMCLGDVIANGPGGIRFLSGGSGVSKLINVSRKRLQNFLLELSQLETSTDVLIFDTGAGVDQRVLTFLRAADEVLIVVTPDPASIADAYATIKVLLRNKKNANIQILMNQVEHERQAEVIYRKLNDIAGHFLEANLSYTGSIRHDSEIVPFIRARHPFVTADPRLRASKDIVMVAKTIAKRTSVYEDSQPLISRLEEAFGIIHAHDPAQTAA
ncbi:MAG: MinD/ParA family protein [Fimbriimonadaceae bacterium]|nr:MinD/ParA family protein [Fimbriimonadaceae bacterium]